MKTELPVRTGWLGDVDFTPDIGAIVIKFEKAHTLNKVVSDLSKLEKPSADDRRILAEGNPPQLTLRPLPSNESC